MHGPSDNGQLQGKASWIAYGALLIVAIWLTAETFAPLWEALLVAAVLAGTTHGWHVALSRKLGERPRVAASLMTLAVVLLVLIPLAVVGIVLVQQTLEAIAWVRDVLREGGLEGLARRLPDAIEQPVRDAAEHMQDGDNGFGPEAAASGMKVASVARQVLESATRAVFGLIMMVIAYFALLIDGRRLVAWIGRALPLPAQRTSEIFNEFRRVSRSVVGSTLVSAGAQALVAAIGYLIAGVPSVLFFTFLTAVIALLPIVGAPMVGLPLAAWLLAGGDTWQAIFLAVYAVVVVGTVDNIVKPWIVRGGMQLNSALVFFALIGGLLAFGAIGLILGPLAVSFFLSLARLGQR